MGSLSRPQSPLDPDSAINPVGVLGTQPPISTPIVLTGVKAQTGINQLRGSTIAGSTGIGIPRQVTNLSATMANASVGSTSKITITFQRNPADTAFGGVVVYAKGYQGNQTPTQVASGTSSPLTVILNNTGESVSLIVQATGNGGSAPLSNAPSCGLRLPTNSTGGVGTNTITNLTATQVQAIASPPFDPLQIAKVSFNSSEVLAGTQKQLVAAPGANKLILPLFMTVKYIYGGTGYSHSQGAFSVYTGSSFAAGIQYGNGGSEVWNTDQNTLKMLVLNPGGSDYDGGNIDDRGTTSSNTWENVPMNVSFFNMAGGNGSFRFLVFYQLLDVS